MQPIKSTSPIKLVVAMREILRCVELQAAIYRVYISFIVIFDIQPCLGLQGLLPRYASIGDGFSGATGVTDHLVQAVRIHIE